MHIRQGYNNSTIKAVHYQLYFRQKLLNVIFCKERQKYYQLFHRQRLPHIKTVLNCDLRFAIEISILYLSTP